MSSNPPPTHPSAKPTIKAVVLALLRQDGQFLMQLRDDFEHIVYPGKWGFFGGQIEPGEAADDAINRELIEELNYTPPVLELFLDETVEKADHKVRRYHYYGELTVPIDQLELNEGQDLALCSEADIRAGKKYSQRLGEMRSLGKPHQRALLKFIESNL